MQYRREAGLHQKTAFILLDILVLFFMQINFLALCISCLRNQIFSNLFAIFVNWPQSRNSRSAKHSSDPSSINCIQCWLISVKKRGSMFSERISKWVMKNFENTLILWGNFATAPIPKFDLNSFLIFGPLCQTATTLYYYFEAFLTLFFQIIYKAFGPSKCK